jgi:hypothetical protein
VLIFDVTIDCFDAWVFFVQMNFTSFLGLSPLVPSVDFFVLIVLDQF